MVSLAMVGTAIAVLVAASLVLWFRQTRQALIEVAREHVGEGVQQAQAMLLAQAKQAGERDANAMVETLTQTVSPVASSLEQLNQRVEQLDRQRVSAEGALTRHVELLGSDAEALRVQTGRLVTALRAPQVRGAWGEMQLRRVVELAGLVEHCDFAEQQSVRDDGQLVRPDMTVRLPKGRTIVVDAKAPLVGILAGVEDVGVSAHEAAQRHARHVRTHIDQLAGKAYWTQFTRSPEFVVMFLPAESLLSRAVDGDPSLLEYAFAHKVIISTPTTLVALLSTVAHVWRQDDMVETAEQVVRAGRELHDRLGKLTEHLGTVGRRLDSAVQAYNQTVSSLESRVLSSAKRLRSRSEAMSTDQIPPSPAISTSVRLPRNEADGHQGYAA